MKQKTTTIQLYGCLAKDVYFSAAVEIGLECVIVSVMCFHELAICSLKENSSGLVKNERPEKRRFVVLNTTDENVFDIGKLLILKYFSASTLYCVSYLPRQIFRLGRINRLFKCVETVKIAMACNNLLHWRLRSHEQKKVGTVPTCSRRIVSLTNFNQ